MKDEEFHIPFIKDLIFIAIVTIVSVGIARFFISDSYLPLQNHTIFTSSQSDISPESSK